MSSCKPFLSLERWKNLWQQQRWIRCGILALFFVLWARAIWSLYSNQGLFWLIGVDFAMLFTLSTAFWTADPSTIYQIDTLNPIYQQLLSTYAHGYQYFDVALVPYPPLFAWMFTPFTMLPPLIGFALWEAILLLAALHLVWRATQFFPGKEKACAALLILTSYPIAYCLLVGNVQLLVACAIAECYLSLRAGRDLRAGLWLSCVLIKPQYGFLLGLLLIWKFRWRAVAGALIGAVILFGGSFLVAGTAPLLGYATTVSHYSGEKLRGLAVDHMTNFRSLVLYFHPDTSNLRGILYMYILGGATILCAALAWRGPWDPRSPRFPTQMGVLLLATLLATFYGYQAGASVLVVPIASMLMEGHPNRLTRLSIMAGAILPTLSFTLVNLLDVPVASRTLTLLLLASYGCLLAELWHAREPNQAPKINGATKAWG
jgi:hypothetical protein